MCYIWPASRFLASFRFLEHDRNLEGAKNALYRAILHIFGNLQILAATTYRIARENSASEKEKKQAKRATPRQPWCHL